MLAAADPALVTAHQVHPDLGPPRVRLEHAVRTVAARAVDADAVVAVLGDACETGGTTPDRLLAHLDSRLPQGTRQHRVVTGTVTAYRDVDYPDHATVVELDGLLGHAATADRWADLDRDVTTVAGGSITLRTGWRQALDPCRLATAVGVVLAVRGWSGTPRACADTCLIEQRTAE